MVVLSSALVSVNLAYIAVMRTDGIAPSAQGTQAVFLVILTNWAPGQHRHSQRGCQGVDRY